MSSSDSEVRLTLRLPTGLRDRLLEKSNVSGRSLNAEIVARLERTMAEEDEFGNIYEYAGELGRTLEGLEEKVRVLWDAFHGKDPYNEDK